MSDSTFKDTMDRGRRLLGAFNIGKTQLVLFDYSNNCGKIDVEVDWSVLEEKTAFKMLGLFFTSNLHWGFLSQNQKVLGAFIRSMKFFSGKVVLNLYNLLFVNTWNSAVMLGLVMQSVIYCRSSRQVSEIIM